MVHGARRWLLGVSAALLAIDILHAQPGPEVVVRVYNTERPAQTTITVAQEVAAAIFDRAGVRLRFRHCESPDDACDDVLAPGEVVARFVRSGRQGAPVFGYAIIDHRAGAGTLATIFVDRVATAAVRLDIDGSALLGRSLAHELGHLLLGTNTHAIKGLMRGCWTDRELRCHRPNDWVFSRQEAHQLRAGAGRRLVVPDARLVASATRVVMEGVR